MGWCPSLPTVSNRPFNPFNNRNTRSSIEACDYYSQQIKKQDMIEEIIEIGDCYGFNLEELSEIITYEIKRSDEK